MFHELARHLQTRRLIAGDSISLDQDKNFYCVIDGLVQVHTRNGDVNQDDEGWGGSSTKGYQLLNEVGSGGTLSSLFTILSLFTEDVRISWQDEVRTEPGPDIDAPPSVRTRPHRSDSDVSSIALENPNHNSPSPSSATSRRNSISSSGSTVHGDESAAFSPGGRGRRPYSRVSTSTAYTATQNHCHSDHGTVAVAVEDATLAVIPAEAFRRLTKKFPKASAHIVQGESNSVQHAPTQTLI